MKLYHGSPKDLDVLIPQQAKGRNDFENQKAVFLTKDFFHSALYAIGKTLKGKTAFGINQKNLIIIGDLEPEKGWVYEVEVKKPVVGEAGQYASLKEIKPIKKTLVLPEDYKKQIIRVKDKEELMKRIVLK